MRTVRRMIEVLQTELPADLEAEMRLPGVRPVSNGLWLRRDEAYADQMSYRRRLIAEKRSSVLWQDPQATEAVSELFDAAVSLLPAMGFGVLPQSIQCPDGYEIDTTADTPLALLGQTVQEDLCVMQKRGEEHVLTAAILCFPASWTLAEKAGKPLTAIHGPVKEYDEQLARRVQRLFDGVQVGKPLWRNNMLRYENPDLFQPRSEVDPQRLEPGLKAGGYMRAERQCIFRLPDTKAVVFSIHSYVVKASL